jgi:hypothetical protein
MSTETNAMDSVPPFHSLQVGAVYKGQRIQHIFGAHNSFIVFSSEGDAWFKFESRGINVAVLKDHRKKLTLLITQAKAWIPPELVQPYVTALANHWADCLRNAKTPLPISMWDELAEEIKSQATDRAKSFYLVSAVLSAIACGAILGIAAYFAPSTEPNLIVALKTAFCGCCGSIASILFRTFTVSIDTYRTRASAFFQGFCRAVIGVFFGAFTYAAIQGGLILGLAKDNMMLIWAFSFIAGFSERLVPDAIEAAQNENTAKDP